MNRIESTIRRVILQDQPTSLIIESIKKSGGVPYAVGGVVRDSILHELYGKPLQVNDVDIEVHGLSLDELEKILLTFGPVSFVGKSFGILKLHGSMVDFALPRSDSSGRKPAVHIDSFMGIEAALKRRDLTMNALAINLFTYELIDPFGGLEDIKNKILRAPDGEVFREDPLRFYRVMQFISRFEMYPESELQKICASMDISQVSAERIEGEFHKLAMLSGRPSLGIRWLADCGRLQEILPELYATIQTEQEPEWHPEGSVFEHSMQAFDAAARFTYADAEQKLVGLYAALCHDLGKAVTTITRDGRIRSPGHDEAGVQLSKKMLNRITGKKELIKAVGMLIKKHMQPYNFVKLGAKPAAYKRLAEFFGSTVTIEQLTLLCIADRQGRNPESDIPLTFVDPAIIEFEKRAQALRVNLHPETPLVMGKDIMQYIAPGPKMGQMLQYAYRIQIDEDVHDKNELIRRIVKHLGL